MSSSPHVLCPACGTVNRVPRDRPAAQARCGGCHAPLFSGRPVDVDADAFARHVRANEIPVLVDVWAPWCGPCRVMGPMFERAAGILEPELRLLKLNADTAQQVTAEFGVRGIPAMLLFQGGRLVGQTAGAMQTNAIVDWVRGQLSQAGRAA